MTGIVQPLQEAGWKVTFEMATVEEAVAHSLKEFDWLHGVMDSRFISGSRPLADELRCTLVQEVRVNRERRSIQAFLQEWRERQANQRDPAWLLEPDLEYSAGSLGELNRIRWAGRLLFGAESLSDRKKQIGKLV